MDLPLPNSLIDYPATYKTLAGGTAILTYDAMPVSTLIECISATQDGPPIQNQTWILINVNSPNASVKRWAIDGNDNLPLIQSQPHFINIGGVLLAENIELEYGWTEEKRHAEQMREIQEKVKQARHQ